MMISLHNRSITLFLTIFLLSDKTVCMQTDYTSSILRNPIYNNSNQHSPKSDADSLTHSPLSNNSSNQAYSPLRKERHSPANNSLEDISSILQSDTTLTSSPSTSTASSQTLKAQSVNFLYSLFCCFSVQPDRNDSYILRVDKD